MYIYRCEQCGCGPLCKSHRQRGGPFQKSEKCALLCWQEASDASKHLTGEAVWQNFFLNKHNLNHKVKNLHFLTILNLSI